MSSGPLVFPGCVCPLIIFKTDPSWISRSGFLGLALALVNHLALPHPKDLRRLLPAHPPYGRQPCDSRFQADRGLALGALPVDHGLARNTHQLAELGLREPQALAQGLDARTGDPEAALGIRLHQDQPVVRHGTGC